MYCKCSGLTFRGPQFKPALVRRNVRFKMGLMNTGPRDSIKRTAKPGLGQGLVRWRKGSILCPIRN